MDRVFFKKTGVIALLIILLYLPLATIKSLIMERKTTSREASREITETWAGRQTIVGPILTIPFRKNNKNSSRDPRKNVGYAHFLPDALNIEARIEPEIRRRSIFEVIVYKTEQSIRGTFPTPDFSAWAVDESRIMWDKAFISMGITGPRGIQSGVNIRVRNRSVEAEPGVITGAPASGLHAWFPLAPKGTGAPKKAPRPPGSNREKSGGAAAANDFTITLSLHGSEDLFFAPVGKTNRVSLSSSWRHPSFQGRYLPAFRSIGEEGFEADWDVAHFGGKYPRRWMSNKKDGEIDARLSRGAVLGVKLIQPVDFYTKSERSVKYGLFLIALAFLAFFMFEVVKKLRVHPMQYILIGFSVCLFYLLLLSLSEHVGFLLAYVLAGASSTGLISIYSASFLPEKKHAGIIAGNLTLMLFAFYIILQHEDYSLLLGSGMLFLSLSAVMYITRNIDWYDVFKDTGNRAARLLDPRKQTSGSAP